jgi:vancomycin resistance protein YoaR
MTKEQVSEKTKKTKNTKVKILLISGSVMITVLLSGVAGALAYDWHYQDKFHPNVYLGEINLGGLTKDQARSMLYAKYENLLSNGITISHNGLTANIPLKVTGSTDPDLSYNFIDINIDQLLDEAFSGTRNGTRGENLKKSVNQIFGELTHSMEIRILDNQINNEIRKAFPDAETLAIPTKFNAIGTGDNLTLEVIEGKSGKEFSFNTFYNSLNNDLQDLNLGNFELEVQETSQPVSESEISNHLETVKEIISNSPYTMSYTNDVQIEFKWTINQNEVSSWLIPFRQNGLQDQLSNPSIKLTESIYLTLDTEVLANRFNTIRNTIDIAPIDAKFEIVNGRVTEFIGSKEGVQLDEDETKQNIIATFSSLPQKSINIAAKTSAPRLATGDVNNLGIREVLGVGISDFSGSPANRIANIRHGANKLNGLLIAPGQTISLVQELKPFTVADGYLPELVIKGDEIKPEVGGGLCQIGTTAFRGAMNAGLQINERRNHSLVVRYYNDPSNNNPGTDATLYDPAPDFKFTNDTAHHILLTTEVDVARGQLIFTFWGTNDGRKGFYTPPQVLRRWAPGQTQRKETASLPPGRVECQAAYTGMLTSFDYIVEYADGTKHEHTYTSQYRALPQICLVGATPKVEGVADESTVTPIVE